MKTFISLFAFMAIFFFGTNLTMSQESTAKQDEYALKKRQFAEAQKVEMDGEKTLESLAKQQAQNLEALLKLDGKQLSQVYNLFLSYEKEMSVATSLNDEKDEMKRESQLQSDKDLKLKEILNPDQYALYLKSMK